MKSVRVFVSSPSDVEHERLRVERVAERLNGELHHVVRFDVYRWDKGQYYTAASTFQAQIPETPSFDIVIGILGHKLGSDMPRDWPKMANGKPYPSGTAYELLTAIEASLSRKVPDVYIFKKQSDLAVPPDKQRAREVLAQWERLDLFWNEFVFSSEEGFKAAYEPYASVDEFDKKLEGLLRHWLERKGDLGRAVAWPIDIKGSPFRGLAAFGAKHAPVFFGRGGDITRAIDALKDGAASGHPFLLLIGSSGSGKSSLARAGLSQRLTTPGVVSAVDRWRVALMRPGERKGEPVLALAQRLFDGPSDIPAEEEGRPEGLPELGKSSHKIPQRLAKALAAGDAASVLWALDAVAENVKQKEGYDRPVRIDLLLIVDQLDELFAADVSETERDAFAKAIAALVATGRVWVIATLRTDLYERFQQSPKLLALKQSGAAYDLAPPGAAELAEIVRKPALAAGLSFERDAKSGRSLDEQLLEDAGRADMLPLVQFALAELFDRREVKGEERLLTFAAYAEIGGLDGAIDKRAEAAVSGLGQAEQASLPRLLRQLAVPAREKGGAAALTIRSVPLAEAAPEEASRRLVQALIDARILLSSGDEGTPVVRLAHERVLKSWGKASDIVRDNADFYRIRDDVEDQLERWRSAKKSDDLLIPAGLALEEARKLSAGYGAELDPATRGYIDASLAADDKRQRGRRLRYRLAAAAAVLFALVAALAGWQWREANQAKDLAIANQARAENERAAKEEQLRRAKINESMFLGARARAATVNGDFELAKNLLSLALPNNWQKPERQFVPESAAALPETLALDDALSATLLDPAIRDIETAEFSPDGTRVLTAGWTHDAGIWDASTGYLLRQLKSHSDSVTSSAFSPDGRLFITGAEGGIAQIWDAATGERLRGLEGHSEELTATAFSPDGKLVLTASKDHTARVWDVVTGEALQVLEGHEDYVNAAVFSPDGTKVLTASGDKTARLWNPAIGEALQVLEGHEDYVNAAVFSPDGTKVLTASSDKTARLWDAVTGEPLQVLRGHEDGVFSVMFSPDGNLVLTASSDKTARIWDAATGEVLRVLNGHEEEYINTAAFSPDGKLVLTSEGNTVRLWDAATGEVLQVLKTDEQRLTTAAFSPNGQLVVTTSSDATTRLWDAATGEVLQVMKDDEAYVTNSTAMFSPDSKLVLTSYDDTTRLWDAANGTVLRVLKGDDGQFSVAVFSPDGKRVLTGTEGGTARIWDATSGTSLQVLKGHSEKVTIAVFSPDGKIVLTGSNDKTVRFWDAVTGAPLQALQGYDGLVHKAEFSPDGKLVLTTSEDDDTARIWDAVTGETLRVLKGHEGAVTSAIFSPDGSVVLTAAWDNTARLWDAATGEVLRVLKGHEGAINTAVFSPDGTRVLTASDDRTARIWDTATGDVLQVLKGHEDNVNTAVFSTEGTLVLTASSDATARLWDSVTGQVVKVLGGFGYSVEHIGFSSKGTRFLTVSSRVARLWDTAATTSAPLQVLRGHEGYISTAVFSPNGTRILTADGKTGRIWDAVTGEALRVLEGHEDYVNAAVFSSDGKLVLTASDDKTARLWDAVTGELLHVLKGHEDGVDIAVFSPDGTKVLTASRDKTARIWNSATGELMQVLRENEAPFDKSYSSIHPYGVTAAVFSPDGTKVLTAAHGDSWEITARIWDVDNGKPLQVLTGHEGLVSAAMFSPDGSKVLTGSFDSTARLWDAVTGKTLQILHHVGQFSLVTVAVLSPDGTKVLTASGDKTARLWDANTGVVLQVLRGHEEDVAAAVFSPDSNRLLTTAPEHAARLWDVTTGVPLEVLQGSVHSEAMQRSSAAVFSPDGAKLLTISGDAVQIWSALPPFATAINFLRASMSRPLTDEERREVGLTEASSALVQERNSAWQECDALAAEPFDPKGVGRGVLTDRLDSAVAIAVCGKAVGERPDDPRLRYQLARSQAVGAEDDKLGEEQREELKRASEANYRAAETAGYPMALYALAASYTTPAGEAITLLRRAHAGGVILAAREISQRYAGGYGVAKDMGEALRWLKLGADEGDPWAAADLGRMYWKGDDAYGVEKDWEHALLNFTLAVRLFEENAYGESYKIKEPMLYRANLARRLPMDKVAEIWDRAHNWKPSTGQKADEQHRGDAVH